MKRNPFTCPGRLYSNHFFRLTHMMSCQSHFRCKWLHSFNFHHDRTDIESSCFLYDISRKWNIFSSEICWIVGWTLHKRIHHKSRLLFPFDKLMLLIGHAMMHKARDFVARCKHRFNNVVVPCEHSQHYGVGEAMTENKFFFFFCVERKCLGFHRHRFVWSHRFSCLRTYFVWNENYTRHLITHNALYGSWMLVRKIIHFTILGLRDGRRVRVCNLRS